jgi:hypothetical protein
MSTVRVKANKRYSHQNLQRVWHCMDVKCGTNKDAHMQGVCNVPIINAQYQLGCD